MNGLNARLTIWRMMNSTVANDDRVGGALLTGSPVYWNVPASLQDARGTQALFEQGLEIVRMVDCIVVPQTLEVLERDEVEVTAPMAHAYYGKRLRVLQVVNPITHPQAGHGHLELKLRRIDRARNEQ